jgi:hypothetical protein
MAELHTALTAAAAAIAAAGLLVGLGLALRGRGPDRLLVGLLAALVVVSAANGLVGLARLAAGGSPRDPLHLLYGVALVVVAPVAAGLAVRRPPRRQAILLAVGALVALGLLFRLAETGG